MPPPSISCSLLVLCLVAGYCGAAQAATVGNGTGPRDQVQSGPWYEARELQRKGRAGMRKDAEIDQVERAKKAAKVALELVAKARTLRVPGQNLLFTHVTAFIDRLDHDQAAGVAAALVGLPAEPASAEPKLVREWATFMSGRRAALTRPTETLGNRALALGVYDIAHDCLDEVLTFDPDSPGLRNSLNLTKIGERWYGPKDMELVKTGLVWDDALGWIVAKDAARYAKGDYFDLQRQRWTTLDEANAAHATLDTGWVVQTEHLDIRGNAPLTDLVAAANALEAFYKQIFVAYSAFFTKDQGDVKLVFGLLDHPRLAVSIASDDETYAESLPAGVKAGWSAGMWVPRAKSSYFSAGQRAVMFHEFTHQILDVFSAQGAAPVWVKEGAAIYTESPSYDVDGRLVLGIPGKNPHLRTYLKEVRRGDTMSLGELFALDHRSWNDSDDPGPQYAVAGAVVQFCMEAENRSFRADFIDYLRDAYLDRTRDHAVWDYIGMPHAVFTAKFLAWGEAIADQERVSVPVRSVVTRPSTQ